MIRTGKGASLGRAPHGLPPSRPAAASQNAGASSQRQAPRAAGAVLLLCAVAVIAPPDVQAEDVPTAAVAGSPQARAAAKAMLEARKRRLLDEQRMVEGQIQALDRRLGLREFERKWAPLVEPSGVPVPLQDPVAERWEIERRGLVDRDRELERRLRNEQFDRERKSRLRSW
jgi:hypothetical protein